MVGEFIGTPIGAVLSLSTYRTLLQRETGNVMYKNVSGQTITFYAVDSTTGAPVTGDAANITAYVSKDNGAVTILADTSATEKSATLALGAYSFSVAKAETNADMLDFTAVSATPGVYVFPILNLYTVPPTYQSVGRGTVTSGSSTTSVTTSLFTPTGVAIDQFKGRIITFDADTTTTALRGQATDITGNTSAAAPTFTVTALTTAPASGDTFCVT